MNSSRLLESMSRAPSVPERGRAKLAGPPSPPQWAKSVPSHDLPPPPAPQQKPLKSALKNKGVRFATERATAKNPIFGLLPPPSPPSDGREPLFGKRCVLVQSPSRQLPRLRAVVKCPGSGGSCRHTNAQTHNALSQLPHRDLHPHRPLSQPSRRRAAPSARRVTRAAASQ